MRKDMKKVLVTDGRYGSKNRNTDVVKLRRENLTLIEHVDIEPGEFEGDPDIVTKVYELEDRVHSPRKSGMRQKDWKGRKEFGEHLSPLYRYVQSNVGRPWDKVFSEIREHNTPDNPVNNHIYDHLWGYVERYVDLDEDGKPVSKESGWRGSRRIWADFYVHPIDGLLKRTPPERKATPPPITHSKQVDDKKYLKRDDGCWFEFTTRELTLAERVRTSIRDLRSPVTEVLIRKGFVTAMKEGHGMRLHLYMGVKLRTLSHAEKSELGLD